jgi:hypothetical protein
MYGVLFAAVVTWIFAKFQLPAGSLHKVQAQIQAAAAWPGTQVMGTAHPGSAPQSVADTLNGSFENGLADWGDSGWGSELWAKVGDGVKG